MLGTTPPPLFTPIVLSSGTHSFTFTPTTSGLYTFGVRRQPPLAGACSFTLDNVKIYSLVASSDYRYAFNGMEKDDEVKGEGNSYDFGERIHDSRLGRFLSIDPKLKAFAWNSVYGFAENRPIDGLDLDGKEWVSTITRDPNTGVTTVHNKVVVKVVDNSQIIDEFNREAFMQETKKQFEATYTQFDKETNTQYTAELVYEFVESNPVGPVANTVDPASDFYIELFDRDYIDGSPNNVSYAGHVDEIGNTQINKVRVKVGATSGGSTWISGGASSFEEMAADRAKTAAHELGHTAGLRHPWDDLNDVPDITQGAPGVNEETVLKNILNSPANPVSPESDTGTEATRGQLKKITETVQATQPK